MVNSVSRILLSFHWFIIVRTCSPVYYKCTQLVELFFTFSVNELLSKTIQPWFYCWLFYCCCLIFSVVIDKINIVAFKLKLLFVVQLILTIWRVVKFFNVSDSLSPNEYTYDKFTQFWLAADEQCCFL